MKLVDLVRRLKKAGCVLDRHGAKHDWYLNPTTGIGYAVPRHREVDEHLARSILKKLGTDDATSTDPAD